MADFQKFSTGSAEYDAFAEGYDDRHESDFRRIARFSRIEARIVELASRGDVLDLGCGTGRLLKQLSPHGRTLLGIDLSSAMLAKVQNRQVAQADARNLPFKTAMFDGAFAAKGVIRYLDFSQALPEWSRVLKPGGWLAIHQYARFTRQKGHWRKNHANDLEETVTHLDTPAQMDAAARAAGLRRTETYLWRSVRFWPYAVKIPTAAAKYHLFSHCLLIFRRGSP